MIPQKQKVKEKSEKRIYGEKQGETFSLSFLIAFSEGGRKKVASDVPIFFF